MNLAAQANQRTRSSSFVPRSNEVLTARVPRTDIRSYGHPVETTGAGGTGARIHRAVELSSAHALLQDAAVLSLQRADQCSASCDSGCDRLFDARQTFHAPILDAFRVGQRQSADGVRRESSAWRSDAENCAVYGQNKFLALE